MPRKRRKVQPTTYDVLGGNSHVNFEYTYPSPMSPSVCPASPASPASPLPVPTPAQPPQAPQAPQAPQLPTRWVFQSNPSWEALLQEDYVREDVVNALFSIVLAGMPPMNMHAAAHSIAHSYLECANTYRHTANMRSITDIQSIAKEIAMRVQAAYIASDAYTHGHLARSIGDALMEEITPFDEHKTVAQCIQEAKDTVQPVLLDIPHGKAVEYAMRMQMQHGGSDNIAKLIEDVARYIYKAKMDMTHI